jgi:hypothetical protein
LIDFFEKWYCLPCNEQKNKVITLGKSIGCDHHSVDVEPVFLKNDVQKCIFFLTYQRKMRKTLFFAGKITDGVMSGAIIFIPGYKN